MSRIIPQTKERVEIVRERRKYLTARQQMLLLVRQSSQCAACGIEIVGRGDTQFDHITSLELGGTNAAENWQALCCHCHHLKTVTEAFERAKTKRLRGVTGSKKKLINKKKSLLAKRARIDREIRKLERVNG